MAAEPRYGLDRLCELAAVEDLGFTPTILGAMLNEFDRLRRGSSSSTTPATSSWVTKSSVGASTSSSSPVPDLEAADIEEALRYAAEAVRERELQLAAGG